MPSSCPALRWLVAAGSRNEETDRRKACELKTSGGSDQREIDVMFEVPASGGTNPITVRVNHGTTGVVHQLRNPRPGSAFGTLVECFVDSWEGDRPVTRVERGWL
jgi:hypothetical protein